jgi:hypothetical protein
MRLYTLYLNTRTSSGPLAPFDKTNLNCVRWNINWNSVFPTSMNAVKLVNNNAKCRIKVQFISDASTAPTWPNQKGTLRVGGLVSNSQNAINGVLLGAVKPTQDPSDSTRRYLECDTTQAQGVEINLPSNMSICVGLYNSTGDAMTTSLEYELILHFELEDDDSESRYITNV